MNQCKESMETFCKNNVQKRDQISKNRTNNKLIMQNVTEEKQHQNIVTAELVSRKKSSKSVV